jgi:hypothetical protein
MTAFLKEHKVVLEKEQYKSKLAAIHSTRKKLDRQLSVIAVDIGIFLLLVYYAFSSMKENEARQQTVSVESFILLFLCPPVVWTLLQLRMQRNPVCFLQPRSDFRKVMQPFLPASYRTSRQMKTQN